MPPAALSQDPVKPGDEGATSKIVDQQLEPAETPETKNQTGTMRTQSLRTPSGALSPTHSSFTVTSGVILWGHIIGMHSGAQPGAVFTNSFGASPAPPGRGRLSQLPHTFRSAARIGKWNIRRYLSNWREEDGLSDGELEHAGWVICHEDLDAMAVLRKASGLVEEPENGDGRYWSLHDDYDGVLSIGRYDWECPGEEGEFEEKFQEWAEPAIGPVVPHESYTPKSNVTPRGYFAVVDAQEWGLDLLRAYKRDCDDAAVEGFTPVERIFEMANGEKVGAYLEIPGADYEYGWLIFSGKKHAQFEADELVGIIYDGCMERLEGPTHAVEPEP
ncbi:hypothetical protein QBC43DRAFT_332137 [Cladorrhinum sp. PSN259]|nr:hypothetical protein QBC43DRAFT_332137 [Cladorrhinum sp. PSN259]